MTMDVNNRKGEIYLAKSENLMVKSESLLNKTDYLLKPENYTTRHDKMDFYNRKPETDSKSISPKPETITEIPTKTIKRSFDVAFLMLPDEKLKQKRAKSPKYQPEEPQESSDEDIEVGTDSPKHKPKYLIHKQIFDDPAIIKPKPKEELVIPKSISNDTQRSAFTKVSLNKDTRLSPSLSISPDLSYQNSLSPSPPRSYQFPGNMLSSASQVFKSSPPISTYPNTFMHEGFSGPESAFLSSHKNSEILQPNLNKIRPMLTQYRPELNPYSYPQFPSQQEVLKMAQPDFKFSQDIRNPAAAILSSLLPPSLAALSLPAQNVCAKCNISFRMTSDLVYHMRSHHKNDSTDYARKRREEKLKCPVCAESFRERHHLTRHMTAHQDKDNDDDDVNAKKKAFIQFTK